MTAPLEDHAEHPEAKQRGQFPSWVDLDDIAVDAREDDVSVEAPTPVRQFRAFVNEVLADVRANTLNVGEAEQEIADHLAGERPTLSEEDRMAIDLVRAEAIGKLRPLPMGSAENPPAIAEATSEDMRFLVEFFGKLKEIEASVRDGAGMRWIAGVPADSEVAGNLRYVAMARRALNQLYYGTEGLPVVFPSDTAAEIATTLKNALSAFIGLAEQREQLPASPSPWVAVPQVEAIERVARRAHGLGSSAAMGDEPTVAEVSSILRQAQEEEQSPGFVGGASPLPEKSQHSSSSKNIASGVPRGAATAAFYPVAERPEQRQIAKMVTSPAVRLEHEQTISDGDILAARPDTVVDAAPLRQVMPRGIAGVRSIPSSAVPASRETSVRFRTIDDAARAAVFGKAGIERLDPETARVFRQAEARNTTAGAGLESIGQLQQEIDDQRQRFLRGEWTEQQYRRFIGNALASVATDDPQRAEKCELLFAAHDALGGNTQIVFTALTVEPAASPKPRTTIVDRPIVHVPETEAVRTMEPSVAAVVGADTALVPAWSVEEQEFFARASSAIDDCTDRTAQIMRIVEPRIRNDRERPRLLRAAQLAGALLAVVLGNAGIQEVLTKIRGGAGDAVPHAEVALVSDGAVMSVAPSEYVGDAPPTTEAPPRASRRAKPASGRATHVRPSKAKKEAVGITAKESTEAFTIMDRYLGTVHGVLGNPKFVPRASAMPETIAAMDHADAFLRRLQHAVDAANLSVRAGKGTKEDVQFLANVEQRRRALAEYRARVARLRPSESS